jgi:O-antigen/teichoic acid export membrane protein
VIASLRARLPADARHAFLLLVGTGATAVLSLAYTLWVARTLGPAASADYFGALFVVSLVGTAFGPVSATVTRFSSVYVARGDHGRIPLLRRLVTRRILGVGAIAGVIGAGALSPLSSGLNFESATPLAIAGAIAFLAVLNDVPRGVLRGLQDFGGYALNTILESGSRLALGIGVLLLSPSVEAALLVYLLATAAAHVAARMRIPRTEPAHGAPPEPERLGRFFVPMFVMTLCAATFHNLDLLFVKAGFSAADAGLYGAAGAFARAFALLFLPFRVLLLPVMSSLQATARPIEGAFLRVSAYFFVLAAVPLGVIALWPDTLVHLLYGERFGSASILLLPMALSMLAGLIPVLLGQAFLAANHWPWLALYVLGLGAEWLALQRWGGSLGSAVAVALTVKGITAGVLCVYFVAWRRSTRGAGASIRPVPPPGPWTTARGGSGE